MTPKEALTETGKSALTGAVALPVGLVSNAGVKNAVKTAMAKNISSKIAKEAIEKNYPLKKEILENLTNRALDAKSKQALTGMLMETPSALVSGASDTATMAGIDYVLNKLQNKEKGTYLDHLKEYAPFMGFSAIPVLSKGVSPVINKAVNSKTGQMLKENINNSQSLSKMDAEIRNALNLGESSLDNVKKYQTVDKHLQKISGSKVKQLPQEEVQNIINAGKISSEEEKTLIVSWKNGNKQKSENKNDLTPQDKFDVIRDSKLTEKDLIDLGIITSEQAKNRLLQQHIAGKGIYYQQFSNHKIDGIDITRDYFLEKNNKKGWFGKKVKEGLTDKATVQDIVRNVKLRKIQASNIKEALNFIEKNFAQRIDEKGIKQGYVPVNRHLLANAMWGKTTKEWYKTLEQGEDAINKAFKNKKQAQGWIELHNRTKTHDFQIPEELFNTLFDGRGENLAEYWSRYENAFKGKTAKLAGTILDIGNNFFKRRVLGTSSFVLNNRMNQLMIAAKSDNPIEYLKSIFQAKNIKDIDLPSEILENSIAEAVENSVKRRTYTGINQIDNLLNLFGGHTIDTKTLTGWKKLTAKTGNIVFGFPNKLYNCLANKLLDFNTKFETFERKA